MKKVFAILIIACFVFSIAVADMYDVYANLAVIINFDLSEDLVFVVDANGNIWAFHGVEDWEIGDYVSMVLCTNGTETIFDDEILSVRYERPDLVYGFNPVLN